MGKVDKEVKSMGKQKVPHMLFEQLQWLTKSPPRQPTCNLSVSISNSGYRANGFKQPSAHKRRDAQLTAVADTGCQAVCMGRTQLQSLGLSPSDLLTPELNLKAANDTGITILGAVFIWKGQARQGMGYTPNMLRGRRSQPDTTLKTGL